MEYQEVLIGITDTDALLIENEDQDTKTLNAKRKEEKAIADFKKEMQKDWVKGAGTGLLMWCCVFAC